MDRAHPRMNPGKVYNNNDITFFSVLMFDKPLCDNVLQPSWAILVALNAILVALTAILVAL